MSSSSNKILQQAGALPGWQKLGYPDVTPFIPPNYLPRLSPLEARLLQKQHPPPPMRVVGGEGPTPAEMLEPDLILLMDDLTDAARLELLAQWVETIQSARRQRLAEVNRSYGRTRHLLPPLIVVGKGAEFGGGGGNGEESAAVYRSPAAVELRSRLVEEGVVFYERPAGALTDAELRRHLKAIIPPTAEE